MKCECMEDCWLDGRYFKKGEFGEFDQLPDHFDDENHSNAKAKAKAKAAKAKAKPEKADGKE